MVIDTSALIAIIKDEPERDIFLQAIQKDSVRLMSVACYLETIEVFAVRIAMDDPQKELDITLADFGMIVSPVTVDQGRIAASARLLYGKNRGHPARLNFGDCLSYALSKATGEPLLFKGNDFIHTDVARVDVVRVI